MFNYLNLIILSNFYPLFMNKKIFHPLNLNLMLIIYSSIICIYISFISSNFFYSFIIFLIMVGGLFILFLYFTSLCPNKYMFYKFNPSMFTFYFFLFFFISFNLNFSLNLNVISNEFFNFSYLNNFILLNNLIMIYMFPYSLISLTLIMFLLIYLILIIKIINFNKSINFMRTSLNY